MDWDDRLAREAGASFPGIDPQFPGLQEVNPFTVNPNDGIQTRERLNERSVDRYRESAVAGATFPAALAYSVDGVVRLVDGFHRLEVSKATIAQTGRPFLVEVKTGTAREALYAALQANTRHGAQLTRQDDENRFLRASEDDELRRLSVRKMAAFLGVEQTRVQRWRERYKWTKPEPGKGIKVEAPAPVSKLPPLSIPYRRPPAPPVLSEEAWSVFHAYEAASAHAAEKGCKGGFVGNAVAGQVARKDWSGETLDTAVRDLARFSVWLYQQRRSGDLKTAREAVGDDNPDF